MYTPITNALSRLAHKYLYVQLAVLPTQQNVRNIFPDTFWSNRLEFRGWESTSIKDGLNVNQCLRDVSVPLYSLYHFNNVSRLSGHYMYRTAVTICTAQWSLYVPPVLTLNNSTFCPHSVFMCYVWISEQTAIISLYSINWLVCITETEGVYCAVRAGYLNVIQAKLSL